MWGHTEGIVCAHTTWGHTEGIFCAQTQVHPMCAYVDVQARGTRLSLQVLLL